MVEINNLNYFYTFLEVSRLLIMGRVLEMSIKYKEYEWFDNEKVNQFKLSKFCRNLVEEKKFQECIDIYESLLEDNVVIELNEYCKREYCKALYAILKTEESIEKKYEYVEKITSNSEQMPSDKEHYNQYVNSIKIVVRQIKKSNNPNYRIVYNLLNKLNPDILSTKEVKKTNGDGKKYILESSQELYYTMYIKALVKLDMFETCILVADKALKTVEKWNYDNDIWIHSRVLYSKCRLADNFEEDVAEYIKFAISKNKWFLYSKVADVLFRQGMIDDSKSFFAKSIITANKRDQEGLVNIFFDLALLIMEKDLIMAKKLIALSYQIRERNGWKVNSSLRYYRNFLEVEIEKKINFHDLQRDLAIYTKMYKGHIKMVNTDRAFGFIKATNNRDYYFKVIKFRANDYWVHRMVYFDVVLNPMKNKEEAINLTFL